MRKSSFLFFFGVVLAVLCGYLWLTVAMCENNCASHARQVIFGVLACVGVAMALVAGVVRLTGR